MTYQLEKTYHKPNVDVQKKSGAGRIAWVDHARGIAIMLVVYRHVVVGIRRSGLQVSDGLYNLQEVFYNFRMPVFFVLSGIFVANSLRKKSRADIAKDRAATILYPYLLWAVLVLLVEICFSRFTNSKRGWHEFLYIIQQPRDIDQLWYLFALFSTSMLYLLLSKLIKNQWLHALLAIGLHIVTFVPFLQTNSFLDDTFYFYPYFFIGTCLSPVLLDKQKVDAVLRSRNFLWVLPVFIAGQWFWFLHRDQQDKYFLLIFLINLVACYFVYLVSYQLSLKSTNDWLAYLGKYSLYIYILHVPVAAIIRIAYIHTGLHWDTLPLILLCWIGGLTVPVILYNSLKRFGFEKLFSLKPKNIS